MGSKTKQEWEEYYKDKIPKAGSIMLESDTNNYRFGDGNSKYKDLSYFSVNYPDASYVYAILDDDTNIVGYVYYFEQTNIIFEELLNKPSGDYIYYADPTNNKKLIKKAMTIKRDIPSLRNI